MCSVRSCLVCACKASVCALTRCFRRALLSQPRPLQVMQWRASVSTGCSCCWALVDSAADRHGSFQTSGGNSPLLLFFFPLLMQSYLLPVDDCERRRSPPLRPRVQGQGTRTGSVLFTVEESLDTRAILHRVIYRPKL